MHKGEKRRWGRRYTTPALPPSVDAWVLLLCQTLLGGTCTRPHTLAAVPFGTQAAQSKPNEVDTEIAEANALRAKLGLKPLK